MRRVRFQRSEQAKSLMNRIVLTFVVLWSVPSTALGLFWISQYILRKLSTLNAATIAILVFAIICILIICALFRSERKEERLPWWFYMLWPAAVGTFALSEFLVPSAQAVTRWITVMVDRSGLSMPYAFVAVVASFAMAYAAFNLRRVNRTVYGHIETIFGLVAILYSITQYDLTHLGVPFFAGMYIVVRGLTNVEDSLPPEARPLTLVRYLRSIWYDLLGLPVVVRE